jgi:putative hydrolase of the HAD superfamily
MSSQVRAVVFDAVGTLIHAEPGAARVYAEVGRRRGHPCDDAQIERRFKEAFRRQEAVDRERLWATSEAREWQRWREIVAEVFGPDDAEACFAELYAHFARPDAWRVAAGAAEAIGSLRGRGWRVALASNLDARLHGIVAGLPALRELDAVIVSSEVGVRKPGRAFFEAIETRLGIPAAHIAFVGDDPVNDAQGAADAGMISILLGKDVRELSEVEALLSQCRLR